MHQIVALWAHPRSLSTALERIFIERGDFFVMHEPFSVLYYMLESRANAAHADFSRAEPADYGAIRNQILETAQRQPVFVKDMCYNCHDHLRDDDAFLRTVTNVFLIRDPRLAIASHFAKNPDVTCEEIGYEKQADIFCHVCELTGEAPPVIAAEDLQRHPAGTIEALCSAIGLEYRADALSWQPGYRAQWDTWKPWHREVSESGGIHTGQTRYAKTVDNDDKLAEYLAHHQPAYEAMRRHLLTVD